MIDLIIPAYNAENTIGRALASIVAQTRPRKFMVTVVDDGSTDATAAVVKKFKGLIPLQYIKLEENLGRPGLVRNVGIEKTNCPYIMFLDSDDILAPNAGEVLSRAILQNQPDFINSTFYQDNGTDKYNVITTKSLTWLHGNIYSRTFLKNNDIKFDECWNEDGSFNLKCFWLSEKYYIMSQPMSYWMNNRDSITRKNNNFLIDITYDYIKTYTEAIHYILIKKPELRSDFKFKKACAEKLAEFFQFIDASQYKKRNYSDVIDYIDKFVQIMYKYNIIDKVFFAYMNRHFNSYEIFPDVVRQNNLLYYLDKFNFNYEEFVNE